MSSRIIVKNLPSYLTQDQLKTRFSQTGNVTDAKVMMTQQNVSRQFGFIGYQTPEEAQEAISYFNKSFIDASRLTVELARSIGDDQLPRPWSRYTNGSSAYLRTHPKQPEVKNEAKVQDSHNVDDIIAQDPKLREFLEVMKPRSQKKVWENDDVTEATGLVATKENDDEQDYQDLTKIQPLITETPAEAKNEPAFQDRVDEEFSGRLFVRNLCYTCSEQDLKHHFEQVGPVSEVHFPINATTKQSKGFAYVTYLMPQDVGKAFDVLDGKDFQGRLLHVLPAKQKPEMPVSNNPAKFKSQKLKEQKQQSTQENTWNSLFMSQDAVTEAMAKKLDVAKSEIMDIEADNMAVRLALAETHVIQDTIKFLKEQGVCIDAFKQIKERSDTTILVKNIPYSTTEAELRELFGRHGDLLRLVIPPTKTLAIVEYTSSQEANTGFKSLAYKNFHGKPLLLEMAPVGAFASVAKPVEKVQEEQDVNTQSATLYVKNLNFSTTDEQLAGVFGVISGFRSAKVSMKTNIKSEQKQSMGFGFVEFDSKEFAKQAMAQFQNKLLNDHAMQLKFSDKSTTTLKPKNVKEIQALSSKLLVRNVAFEATRQDLLELFGTFGQLKRVKLPKKFDGKQHRGFAFVDFLTKQEAKNAFESLHSTHLYGRHLVIEWAQEDDSVDTLRLKTKNKFDLATVNENNQKRLKVDIGSDTSDQAEF